MIGKNLVSRKSFLLGTLSFATVLMVGNWSGAIAGTFSIKAISAQIARRTNVPILLPSEQVVEQYKFDKSETIYAYLGTDSDSYYTLGFYNFYHRSVTPGNAAFRFSISAKRRKDFERRSLDSDPRYSPSFSQVKLSDNSNALITSWCGGTACWSTVQWKSNGVLYEVASKRRQPDAALAIANSAVREGNRNKR
ncbi:MULTISPECIES: hypothetical protein [Pseudanabaena]|uniref:hypothetical protein n=1 Tax=Pseudanabaena TaxID=1152 RepID=UPI00247A9A60|nr:MULTISPECIES: hypothetical protein [Pseudanabaena]MEA5489448.1 hypothetical protein [Pseudanabaena sp. CCNP1317]WGS73333.1 hypothetical protein OA858_04690 [Pseudanabaena galeata CCNP1313]